MNRKKLRQILRESFRSVLAENVCHDEDAIWDCIDDDGEAYAPRPVAEEWMDNLGNQDRRNMTMDTRVTIMYDDMGEECECVKITDRSFRGSRMI